MYELFILGELIDQPMHGYLLREIINMAIGPLRQMSWGALYPLLRRLEANDLIEQLNEPSEAGERLRKVYRITPEGRERFFFLMLRPEEFQSDYPDIFSTKLINFDQITTAQRQDILEQYKSCVQFIHRLLLKSKGFVQSEKHISEKEKKWILLSIEHSIHQISADLSWINELENELKKEVE